MLSPAAVRPAADRPAPGRPGAERTPVDRQSGDRAPVDRDIDRQPVDRWHGGPRKNDDHWSTGRGGNEVGSDTLALQTRPAPQ